MIIAINSESIKVLLTKAFHYTMRNLKLHLNKGKMIRIYFNTFRIECLILLLISHPCMYKITHTISTMYLSTSVSIVIVSAR